VPVTPEEEFVARRGQRQSDARRTPQRSQRQVRRRDDEGIIPVLARAVREVEAAVQRGVVMPSVRTKFQVIALLVREARADIKTDQANSEAYREAQLKRLDGVATILAKTAARDTSLLALLAEDAVVSEAARSLKRDMLRAAGFEPIAEEVTRTEPVAPSAASGHRTFLLADEPGLGKTAQALLAAQAAKAYPLLVVVPNVVKTNWAREAGLWTPNRPATVIHGNGDTIDGFADIVIVNYEVLDRHVGWLGDLGFRGMVVDEAHFIKNKTSQRSQHVLELSERIRSRTAHPLLMALTGTPLINDIEDFRAIWQFLGWIDDKKPLAKLMDSLEDTGLMPGEPGFYPAARNCVVDLGIVRRRKIDVAADIPARRIADLPVELDDEAGRSIREAERELARRLVARYEAALERRTSGKVVDGIDHDLVRRVATWEREDTSTKTDENVFSMMRRIGQAKAGLAADYAAQLARSVGKVVFFAKHVDVMDVAEETFAKRGIRFSSIRGDQTPRSRQKQIDAFVNDPDVAIVVCSLTAAGVGVNLQVASNVVLAELSWTDAEQTQAIDRVHRIGQGEPVTAWRIIAAQTIDTRIAELIDSKAGLAAKALDGSDEEVSSSADVQLEALVALLTDALSSSS
jgi:SNF2 family DNA or RNA helicase